MARVVEHFASGLGSFSALTAGTGTMVASDHMALGTLNASGDAAAIYKAFDPSKNQIIWVCAAAGLGTGAPLVPWPAVRLIHAASAPTPDLRANFNVLLEHLYYVNGGVTYDRLTYTDTSGTKQRWSDASQAWSSSTSTISMPAGAPNDDFRLYGIEWDATNSQVRLIAGHTVSGSSENADYGPHINAITDWIPLSSIQNGTSSTLWLVIGSPETNFFLSTSAFGVEWVVEQSGTDRVHVYYNGKDSVGGDYNITHDTGYDLRVPWLVPGTRGQIALEKGAPGSWNDVNVQWGSAIRAADGNIVQSFSGNAGSTVITTGIATAPSPFGPWTQYAGNPVIALTPSTDYSNYIRFNVLVEDWQETDPNKRYKLLVNANDGSTNRTLLFYAPDYTGPYTLDGRFLEDDGTETSCNVNAQPIWYAGQWYIIYNADVAGVKTIRYATAATLRAGQCVKANTTIITAGVGGWEATISAVSGKIWTVDDTTNAVKDMSIVVTKTSSADTYGWTRVRKVIDSTHVEVYHSCPGAASGSVIRSHNYGNDLSFVNVVLIEGIYYYITCPFQVFSSHPSYSAHFESNGVFVGGSSPVDTPTIDWFATPLSPFGRDAWNTTISHENPRPLHTPTRFAQGGGTLALALALAGAGTVASSGISGSGTLPLSLGLAGAGAVEVRGTGTLALSPGLTGAGTIGNVTTGSGTLALTLALTGAGTVPRTGTGTLALTLDLAGAGTVPRTGAGTLPIVLGLAGTGAVGSVPLAGVGTLPLSLGLAGAGTVDVRGAGTLALALDLSGAGTVDVIGAGTLPLVLGLSGTGAIGSVPLAGSGVLALTLGLSGAGTVAVRGAGTLPLVLQLSGAGTVPRTGSGALPLVLHLVGAGTVYTGAPYAGMIRLTAARGPRLAIYAGPGPALRFTPVEPST